MRVAPVLRSNPQPGGDGFVTALQFLAMTEGNYFIFARSFFYFFKQFLRSKVGVVEGDLVWVISTPCSYRP
ncbi:MAG: hypothetical protein MZV63_12125 [Marinilabiliales bacterium]|nr:hypothetical protein [Marinilabiliales bacterium]